MYSQQKNEQEWVQGICNALVDGNDLSEYNVNELPENINIDFMLVEKANVKEIKDSIFVLSIDHGKGNFCTELEFKFTKKDNKYYLVFSEVFFEDMFGELSAWIRPWHKQESNC